MGGKQEIELVYDDQCPICRSYCKRVRLADDRLNLVRVDARLPGATVHELMARGLDVNEGMAVTIGGTLYYGSRAIHELTLIADARGPFGRLNGLLFGSRRLSRVSYAVGKFARNIVLCLIGVEKIRHALPDDAAGAKPGRTMVSRLPSSGLAQPPVPDSGTHAARRAQAGIRPTANVDNGTPSRGSA